MCHNTIKPLITLTKKISESLQSNRFKQSKLHHIFTDRYPPGKQFRAHFNIASQFFDGFIIAFNIISFVQNLHELDQITDQMKTHYPSIQQNTEEQKIDVFLYQLIFLSAQKKRESIQRVLVLNQITGIIFFCNMEHYAQQESTMSYIDFGMS